MINFVIVIFLILIVSVILRYMWKNRKRGCCGCSGCASCSRKKSCTADHISSLISAKTQEEATGTEDKKTPLKEDILL